MKMPETRPVSEHELDRIVTATGRTRGVFANDPSAAVSKRRRRPRLVEVEQDDFDLGY